MGFGFIFTSIWNKKRVGFLTIHLSLDFERKMTFFDDMKQDFGSIPRPEGQIATSEFLDASASLVKLFDLLGSSAFAVVQNDMNGNITKIKNKLTKDPIGSNTLEKLILSEVGGDKTATQGLLWLTRGLEFTCQAMQKALDNQDWELSKCFEKSYSETLSQYHSFLIKPVFKLAMKACPYRADFFKKLGDPLDTVVAQLKAWVQGLAAVVTQIMDFFKSGNYGKGL